MEICVAAPLPWRQCEVFKRRQAVEVSALTKRRGPTQWVKLYCMNFYRDGSTILQNGKQEKKKGPLTMRNSSTPPWVVMGFVVCGQPSYSVL